MLFYSMLHIHTIAYFIVAFSGDFMLVLKAELTKTHFLNLALESNFLKLSTLPASIRTRTIKCTLK